MTNLSAEDIDAIAKKIVELTKNNVDITPRGKTPLSDITNKYHQMLYRKYGATGTMQAAIRTTCCLMAGQRYCSSLRGEQMEKACEYMEYIYQTIEKLGDDNDETN